MPGVCQQQVLQLHSQDHCPHAGLWAESAFPFLIFTLQETCNLLIDMARKFLDPSSIFQIEVGMHVLLSIFCPEIVLHQLRKTRYVWTYFQVNPIFENLATLVHFTLFLASL